MLEFYISDKCKKLSLIRSLYFGFKCKKQKTDLETYISISNVKNRVKIRSICFGFKCRKTGCWLTFIREFKTFKGNDASRKAEFFYIYIGTTDFWRPYKIRIPGGKCTFVKELWESDAKRIFYIYIGIRIVIFLHLQGN